MRTKIIVGSRASKLALIQAESVVTRMKEINPGLETSIVKIVTAGDKDRHTSLDQIGINVFVKELEEALLDGRIDLAVHSLKDLPTELPAGLSLLAVTERLDPSDVLIARSRLDKLPHGSRIGTGSLRRSIQLARLRPDIEALSIRGNVDTRLHKIASGEVDGVIMAAAAMLRLGWQDRITEYLPLESFLPAAGQGALALEARLDDKELAGLVSQISHIPTWQGVAAERAFLRALGGGCRAPIAALGTVSNNRLRLEGMVASAGGRDLLRAGEDGNPESPEEVGMNLANKMLGLGAADFIAEAKV